MPLESPAQQRQAYNHIGAALDGQKGNIESEVARQRKHEDWFEERVGLNCLRREVGPRCLRAPIDIDEPSQLRVQIASENRFTTL